MNVQPARIGLNAHLLSLSQSYRGAGISWYIINLLKNLAHVSPEELTYSAFLSDRAFADPALTLHFSQLPTHRPVVRIFWEQFIQPWAVRQAHINLLHALAFVAPVVVPCPYVVTVYDLSFLRYPEAFKPFNRWYLSRGTARSVQRAQAVIAISESTRQDVINLLGVPAERVHTIYCGVEARYHPLPPAEIEAFKLARHLPNTFILYLGTLEPRKNVDGLIRAYGLWRARQPDAPPLIVAGAKGWYYRQIFELVESLNLTESVRFPGYIPQDELSLWYNAATLFVYPSHFEGFGLPVLEAMACGTPVVTSTTSSLPEITGTEGISRLVDPTNDEALAIAMAEVMADTAVRRSMSERGVCRAAEFTWEQTARETVAIYQNILGL